MVIVVVVVVVDVVVVVVVVVVVEVVVVVVVVVTVVVEEVVLVVGDALVVKALFLSALIFVIGIITKYCLPHRFLRFWIFGITLGKVRGHF